MQLQPEKVKDFFDRLASTWDSTREPNYPVIERILDAAGITGGVTVLDAACGTGVLFPSCLRRGVRHLTGVDLSPEMIRIAGEKFTDPRLTLLTGDAEALPLPRYDRIILFNAFPHFPHPQRLIASLSGRLLPGGRLTIAHDRSRFAVNGHHEQEASEVSLGLSPAGTVAEWFAPHLTVDTAVDNDTCYIVSGAISARPDFA